MTLSILHIVGISLVLLLILGIGVYSGRKVRSAADFTNGGGRAGAWLVSGTIMGTLVSGQATVGTAQLAFAYGMSAWWFTLGAGFGCLILGLGYAKRMRHSAARTLVGVIAEAYGPRNGYLASILSAVGIFISVIAQMLSAVALLTAILPIPAVAAAVLSVVIMAGYVIFGGVWGAGIGGVVKLVLLYIAAIAGGVLVLLAVGGIAGLQALLGNTLLSTDLGAIHGIETAVDLTARFGDLLARGPLNDLGAGLSLVLGVLSTQTYASAIWAAESDEAARKGALLSALLIPPIGVACILIGLFMRGQCITSAELAALHALGQEPAAGLLEIAGGAQAFPAFVLSYMPKLLGGVVLGTLLITIVGGGAGLSLGVATVVMHDMAGKRFKGPESPGRRLAATRGVIVVVLVVSAAAAAWVPSAIINDIGYLSMGLRGAVIFVPLSAALFSRGGIGEGWVTAALIAGPLLVFTGKLQNLPFDSLFLGIAAGLLLMFLGGREKWNCIRRKKRV